MIKKSSQLNDKVVLPKTEGIIEKETKRDEAETNILEAKRRVNLTIETLKATNPLLGRCDRASLVVAILNAQELGLSVDPILGEVYIIPYRNKTDLTYRAQLQIGYRGFIKLAYNTGIFKVIRVSDVRAGEEEKVSDLLNKESGMIDFSLETLKKGIAEYEERRKKPVIGYLAMFELKDGTRELKFMSLEECKDWAQKYSDTYRKNRRYTIDNDKMFTKTVLKALLRSERVPTPKKFDILDNE